MRKFTGKKTIEEINGKIRNGDVVVITAEEMTDFVKENGTAKAAKEIDVVTTGTFGMMCSSGAFLNFGHSDPPIKFGGGELHLNDVPAYTGLAAVDTYIGSTAPSRSLGLKYGGGHVIEDLIAKKTILLEASAYGTDCYPRKQVKVEFTIDDINQAYLYNPRNGYQRYFTAVNSTDKTIYTYLGELLPNFQNAGTSGAGELSPLMNDPDYETIGIGTRVLVGGNQGYVLWEGTQHNPSSLLGTLAIGGNLRGMSTKFIRGASVKGYGTSLYVGLGIPIPILNEGLAKKTGISDREIKSTVLDYSVPSRSRPPLAQVTYEQLKSGRIELNGKEVRVNFLSSLKKAREVAGDLKKKIKKGEFFLTNPVEKISTNTVFKPMSQKIDLVAKYLEPASYISPEATIEEASSLIISKNKNQLIVTNGKNELEGIITSWDIAKAVTLKAKKVKEVMTRQVVTVKNTDTVLEAIRLLKKHDISSLPVLDGNKVVGMVTAEAISKKHKGD